MKDTPLDFPFELDANLHLSSTDALNRDVALIRPIPFDPIPPPIVSLHTSHSIPFYLKRFPSIPFHPSSCHHIPSHPQVFDYLVCVDD